MQVVVIGDAMIDTYMWGTVERMSPEAPVPVVSVEKKESRLGGAGNVSLNLKELGATPYLFSVVGDDEKGKRFVRLLAKNELWSDGIFTDQSRVTTVKNRIMSKGQQVARVDEESVLFISHNLEHEILKSVEKLLNEKRIDVILFVDYDKGVITPSLFNSVNKIAKEKGIVTAADPKKRNFTNYKNITLFKPNFKEFIDGTGIQAEKKDFAKIGGEALKIRNENSIDMVFITLSEQGVLLSNGNSFRHYPANIRYIADVSGAGDTVISVASLAVAAGLQPELMALMANLAGGLVCEKPGVIPVDKQQLKHEMLTLRIG
jgi:rfaE bifunctional protein kinase chain/domain